jgi:predicted DNA-binding protein (UPF0251 family)
MQEEFEVKERSYTVSKLWSRSKEILRLVASGLYTQREVAEIVGVTPQTVNNLVNCALGKETLEMLDGAADAEAVDLIGKIKALAPIALALQQEMMLEEGTPKRLKNDIANKVLDRAGYVPVTKNMNLNLNGKLTRDDVMHLKERANELRKVGEDK